MYIHCQHRTSHPSFFTVTQRDGPKLEEEIKLAVKDIPATLSKIRSIAKYVRTEYLRDIIYGIKNDKKKIRMRIQDNFEFRLVDATYKYRVAVEDGIKKEIEETLGEKRIPLRKVTRNRKRKNIKQNLTQTQNRKIYK